MATTRGTWLLGIVFVVSSAAHAQDQPLQTVDLVAAKDVAAARDVSAALSALSQKVTACVTSGASRETCRCRYPDLLARLRKGYEALIKEHPAWKDRTLTYRSVDDEGRPVNGLLVLRTLRAQLEGLTCDAAGR